MKKHILLTCLALALAVFPVRSLAQQDSHHESAKKLMDLTLDIEHDLLETSSKQFESLIKSQFGECVESEGYDILNNGFKEVMKSVFDEIYDDFVQLYVDNFTEEELNGLIEFNSSPLGQKSLRILPKILKFSNDLAQKKMQEKQGTIAELSQKVLENHINPVCKNLMNKEKEQ